MATITTGLALHDQMTSVVKGITNSLNLTLSAMEDVQRSMDTSFDSRAIENARNAIQQTEVSIQNLTPPIDRAEQEQEKFNRSLQEGDRSAGDLTRRITGFIAAYAGFRATTRLLGGGFGIYRGFEQEMSRVRALSGATQTEFERLNNEAKLLGETTPFTARQAAEGMSFLAMAGFETGEVLAAMPGLLNTAGAGQMELGQTADIVSNILQGFNISAVETGRVADVLTKAFTSSNTDLAMLGETMKYVAPNAYAAGIALEETAAAAGILGNAGIQASMAGTSLRAIISRMSAPTGEAARLMEELGISTVNTDGTLKSLSEIVRQVSDATELMGNVQTSAAVKTLVGERAAASFLTLMEAGPDAIESFTSELENSAGTAEEIMNVMLDNTEGKLMLFRSQVESAWISFYERLGGGETAEAFDAVLDGMLNALNALLPVLENILTYTGMVVNYFTENWSWISPIIWGIVTALGAYIAVTKGAAIAQSIWNAAMAANPIIAIVMVIIALITIFIRLWKTNDAFYAGFMRVWNSILNFFDRIPAYFWQFAEWMLVPFSWWAKSIGKIYDLVINSIIKGINTVLKLVNKITGSSYEIATEFSFENIAEKALEFAGAKRDEAFENAAIKAAEREQKLLDSLEARAADRAQAEADRATDNLFPDTDLAAGMQGLDFDLDHIGMVDEVGKIRDTVDISSEDLKMMRELAEMRNIQNFVTLQPQLTFGDTNIRQDGRSVEEIIANITDQLNEEIASSAKGVMGLG